MNSDLRSILNKHIDISPRRDLIASIQLLEFLTQYASLKNIKLTSKIEEEILDILIQNDFVTHLKIK